MTVRGVLPDARVEEAVEIVQRRAHRNGRWTGPGSRRRAEPWDRLQQEALDVGLDG